MRQRHRWVLLFLWGCSDHGLVTMTEHTVPRRVLAVSPGSLNFGGLPAGASATAEVTITSVGTATVALEALVVPDAREAYAITWAGDGRRLAPGESIDATVRYTPQSRDDRSQALLYSDAVDAVLPVALYGGRLEPALTVSPSNVVFTSQAGEPVSKPVTLTNVGETRLVVTEADLGDWRFTLPRDALPLVLAPEAFATLSVTYTPAGEVDLAHDVLVFSGPDAHAPPVRLAGEWMPCLGLAEAWSRSLLDIYSSGHNDIILENRSSDTDLCMDRWYVYISEETQDAGAGDPWLDPGGDYPLGSIVLRPGEQLALPYAGTDDPHWWCMEETHVTAPTDNFTFLGAAVPEPLLSEMLDRNQDGVWSWMRSNPVMLAGRDRHEVTVGPDRAPVDVDLVVLNMGQQPGTASVTETIPAGFVAEGFSVPPDATIPLATGQTSYRFDGISLAGAEPTPRDQHSIYDRWQLRYTLRPVTDCLGRYQSAPPRTAWADEDGVARSAEGSPMVLRCPLN